MTFSRNRLTFTILPLNFLDRRKKFRLTIANLISPNVITQR
jgi:hypothetical protein